MAKNKDRDNAETPEPEAEDISPDTQGPSPATASASTPAPEPVKLAPLTPTIIDPTKPHASSPRYAQPHHYRDGRLTREGMEHVIRNGGSVTISPVVGRNPDGSINYGPAQVISKVEDLPSTIQLADNSDDLDRAEQQLEAEAAALQTKRAQLDKKRKKVEKSEAAKQ